MSLEETIATHLRQRGWHLALAETTTGGIIAVRLVRLAGSSAYFDRSIVAYSKEAKVQSLGVDPGVFERSGSVSVETACAMAEGLHRLSQADMVLAETGHCWADSRTVTEATGEHVLCHADANRYAHRRSAVFR